MIRSSMLLIALASMAVVPRAHARALNFCFNPGLTDPDLQSLAVAERFKKPSPGSCSPITGFDLAREGNPLITGTACLDSAGDSLRVAYTVMYSSRLNPSPPPSHLETFPLWVYMTLPYPGGPGGVLLGGDGAVSDTMGGRHIGFVAHANPCIPPSPALP